jgi:putative ABC transport system permease protein
MVGADNWQEVFQALRRNRLRTFLTACGVFWGVFMLVVMLGFGRGLEKGATRSFGTWAMNTVGISPETTSRAYAGRGPGRQLQLTMDDAEAVAAQVDGVAKVVPRTGQGGRFGGQRVARNGKMESFQVIGETADYQLVEDLRLEAGRFLDGLDERDITKVAVIGARVREVLFTPDEDPIGATITVNGTQMKVVGVHRTPMSGRRADWANGRIFIPRATLARMYGQARRVSQMAVLVSPKHDAIVVEEAVKALLRRRHAVHPEDTAAFESWNRAREYAKVQKLFRGISGLTWIVGVLTLLAGAIGVSNIMMIAVAERTREFGIRKAVGATPASIVVQVVTEASVLTGLAGYMGLVAGVAVVELAARIMDALPPGGGASFFGAPEVDLKRALVAAVVLTTAGALAGLAPARAAVAVRPVEALAHE